MPNTYCYEFGMEQGRLINGYINTKQGYQLDDFYARGITPEGWLNFIPGFMTAPTIKYQEYIRFTRHAPPKERVSKVHKLSILAQRFIRMYVVHFNLS